MGQVLHTSRTMPCAPTVLPTSHLAEMLPVTRPGRVRHSNYSTMDLVLEVRSKYRRFMTGTTRHFSLPTWRSRVSVTLSRQLSAHCRPRHSRAVISLSYSIRPSPGILAQARQ